MCCIQGIQESNEDCLPCMVERPAAKDKTQRKSEVQPMQIRGDVKSNMLYPILLRVELFLCAKYGHSETSSRSMRMYVVCARRGWALSSSVIQLCCETLLAVSVLAMLVFVSRLLAVSAKLPVGE